MAVRLGEPIDAALAPHFQWGEVIAARDARVRDDLWAALRLDLDTQENARALAQWVLEPLRREHGPIRVTSWYRTARHNSEVGGAPRSLHLRGAAADIVPVRASPEAVVETIRERLRERVDEAIYYPDDGHIHVALAREFRRGEVLVSRPGEPLQTLDAAELVRRIGGAVIILALAAAVASSI